MARKGGREARERGPWWGGRVQAGGWLLSGLILGGALALPYLVPGNPRDRPYEVDPSRVRLLEQPRWLGESTAGALCRSFSSLRPASLRDDEAVASLLHQLSQSSGWIERVERVVKRYPDQLDVHVDLREPIARVNGTDGEYLVDERARVLGPSSDAPELIRDRQLPLVHHPAGAVENLEPGRRIADEDVVQGVAVAAELKPFREQLAGRDLSIAVVDVSPLVSRRPNRISDVDLYTADELCIEWGRPSSSSPLGALEMEPAVKIKNLMQAAARYPGFAGICRVRVQFEPGFHSVEREPGAPSATGDSYRGS